MSKIILAQIDTIAGDIEFNKNKIIECIKRAQSENADLIIFPELALLGYPFGDIIMRHKSITARQLEALEEIKAQTQNITALIGYAEPVKESGKKPFYNSAAVLQNGKLLYNARKKLLPNYGEFNDYRYFEPSDEAPQTFELNGLKYGVLVCEDSFNHKSFFKDECIYNIDPVSELMKLKPDVIINCSASPSRCGKEYLKNALFSSIAEEYRVNYIYVNKAGYADNLSFEGVSRVYGRQGALKARAAAFEEDFLIIENMQGKISPLPEGSDKAFDFYNFSLNYENDLERTYKSIVSAVKQYFSKNGFSKAVLGLSGGLDSSVCAVLLADALGAENVWGISMPSRITSHESRSDAKILSENLGINFLEIPLKESLDSLKSMLNGAYEKINAEKYEKSTALENLQARLRAVILWGVSNEFKGMLPIATSDKSEAYIGYATVNGDMSGGFAPIADVTKTKLFKLADFLNRTRPQKNAIPASVLLKPPGAELKINPKTGKPVYAEEDNMPYEFLDEIIFLAENKGAGKNELLNHKFLYEQEHQISLEQKKEWIDKFFWKSKCAVYKWHIMPQSVITDAHSINSAEYRCPVISKVY